MSHPHTVILRPARFHHLPVILSPAQSGTKDLLTTKPRGSLGGLAVLETLRAVDQGTVLFPGLRVTGLGKRNVDA